MIDLIIDGCGSGGDGVGRLPDGRAVFVPGALPGDRVRARLTSARKGVQYAEVQEVLDPSPERVTSFCGVDACGGCALREASMPLQARLKRRRLADNLRRIGKLDVEALLGDVRQLGDGLRYRHRVRLHAAWRHGGLALGYFGRRSHELAPLTSCPVLWTELEHAARALAAGLTSLGPEARLESVELGYSRRDGRAAVTLHGHGPMAAYRRALAALDRSSLAAVEVESEGERSSHGNLELRYDHGRAASFDLRFEPGVFTQAFPEMNDALVSAVLRALQPHEGMAVLELHAGIGNFSLPLALAGARVVAVERDRRAAALCRSNVKDAGAAIDVRECADDAAIAEIGGAEVVLLDPPRTGARAVAAALAAGGPGRVAYVSCDSATLARDAAILTAGGYALVRLEAFDMFPQTPHVEALALFERATPATP